MSGQETLRFLTAALTHLRDSGDFIGRKEFLAWGQEIVSAWNRRTPDPAQIRADALREALGNAATTIKNLLEVMATPDQRQCCDGSMCGCMGSTVYQEAEYYALQDVAAIAALLDTTLSPTAVDGSPAPDAGGKRPCNECYLPANETCDICGAVGPSGKAGGKEGVA